MTAGSEPIYPLAGRLRRVGEMLIGLSGSPVPTHLFQTLAEQAETLAAARFWMELPVAPAGAGRLA
jgi:hypothetical protein